MNNTGLLIYTQNDEDFLGDLSCFRLNLYEKLISNLLQNDEQYLKCSDWASKFKFETEISKKYSNVAYLYSFKSDFHLFLWKHFDCFNLDKECEMFYTEDFCNTTGLIPIPFSITDTEFFIGICNENGVCNHLKIFQKKENEIEFVFSDIVEFAKFFDVEINDLKEISKQNSVNDIVDYLSELLFIPFDLTFNKIDHAPKHLGAYRFRA